MNQSEFILNLLLLGFTPSGKKYIYRDISITFDLLRTGTLITVVRCKGQSMNLSISPDLTRTFRKLNELLEEEYGSD